MAKDPKQAEQELAELRRQIEALRQQTTQAVEETERKYRRDLVPLQQSLVLWRGQASRRR